MKITKILAIGLMVMLMISSFVGCDEKNKVIFKPEGKIVSDEGVELDVSLKNKGKVSHKYDLSSYNFELDGKAYTLPTMMPELIENGWSRASTVASTTIPGKRGMHYNGVTYVNDNGKEIQILIIYNDTGQEKDMDEGMLISFVIDCSNGLKFELPGGINEKSTAVNVLNYYGDPADPTEFEKANITENTVEYVKHEASGLSFQFTFDADGTIESVKIEYDLQWTMFGA